MTSGSVKDCSLNVKFLQCQIRSQLMRRYHGPYSTLILILQMMLLNSGDGMEQPSLEYSSHRQ